VPSLDNFPKALAIEADFRTTCDAAPLAATSPPRLEATTKCGPRNLRKTLKLCLAPSAGPTDGGYYRLKGQPMLKPPMKRALTATMLLATALGLGYRSAQGQSNEKASSGTNVRYPTMMDLTFPEFEAAVKQTNIVLLPIGAIEEHSSHLPLGTDSMNATALLFQVQAYLRKTGVDTILGPPLNIGITNEADDWSRDGTYVYPGSLTVSKSTFVALYVDVLRSLHDNGLRRAFLYPGHLGGRHIEAVVQVVEEANRRIAGMEVFATINGETLERMKLAPTTHIISVEQERNFELMAQLLGRGQEMPTTSHADGVETSWTLHFYPEAVRPGYERLTVSPSSIFREVLRTGDRSKNPTGTGGFPFDKASAAVGKQIVDYRSSRVGDAILRVLKSQ
jgi:creatinine amidohydrolase